MRCNELVQDEVRRNEEFVNDIFEAIVKAIRHGKKGKS